VAAAAIAVLAASVVLSVVRSLVTYGNLLLRRDGDLLHLEHGLLRVRENTFDMRRLRGGTLREALLVRAFGGARLDAVMTGVNGAGESSLLLPPCPATTAHAVLADMIANPDAVSGPLRGHGPAAAGATQLQAFRGDATKAPTVFLTTASGSSLVYGAVSSVTQSTNPHSNAGFRLLGDGTSFDPAAAGIGTDGIYLQGMQITTTATTPGGAAVAASDPLFMVFYKNTSFDDAYAVAAAFATSQGIPLGQIQSVPEPTTAALVAAAAVAGLAAWRRRRGLRAGSDQ
jgi:hypothetical protein